MKRVNNTRRQIHSKAQSRPSSKSAASCVYARRESYRGTSRTRTFPGLPGWRLKAEHPLLGSIHGLWKAAVCYSFCMTKKAESRRDREITRAIHTLFWRATFVDKPGLIINYCTRLPALVLA